MKGSVNLVPRSHLSVLFRLTVGDLCRRLGDGYSALETINKVFIYIIVTESHEKHPAIT